MITQLASMEHFPCPKKNKMGQTKSSDISQIDKKCFRDMTWLKQNVTKRVILRITMTHFDPIGAHLSISLNNFKLLSSKIMATTNVNQYDQTLNDENLLLQIGKNLELLSTYKDLKPLPRALIPDKHQIYGITIYKDGSITAQSCVAYLLSTPKKMQTSNFQPTISPQKVVNPTEWLQEQVVDDVQPIFPPETETFSAHSKTITIHTTLNFCRFKIN